MKQSRKGQQWFFGTKAHTGAVAESGLVHTVRSTAGSVPDVAQANRLLHGQEKDVFADAGYQGAYKRANAKAHVNWNVAMRPGLRRRQHKINPMDAVTEQIVRTMRSAL